MSAGLVSGLYLVFAGLAWYGSWQRKEPAGLAFWGPVILANIWIVAWRLS